MKVVATIDCVALLAERLSPFIPEARRLRAPVTDLQINYTKLI